MSLMLTSFARQGVRPPPSFVSVSASLTRYDSGTGTALFRGTIPFQPGMITSAGDLNTVRVLVNGYEPSGGLWIELLEPKHAGGASYKVAYVEFDAACGSAETVSCEVRIGQARATADRGSVTDSTQRAPLAWCREPTLFFVTDADYRVSCRLTALPLVTMATVQANCPAAWEASLTTEYDSRLASVTPNSGTASYNMHYALLCRAEMTGNPADAAAALAEFIDVDGNTNSSGGGHYLSFYTPSTGSYSPEMRLGSNVTKNSAGYGGEQWDAGPTLLLGYMQTGALQLRNSAEIQAGQASWSLLTSLADQYGMRFNLRKVVACWLIGRLLGTTRTIQYVTGGWTYNPATLSATAQVDVLLDELETQANTLITANGTPAWLQGFDLYGWADAAVDGNQIASFQIGTAVYPLLGSYLNFSQDARILTALDGMVDFLDTQLFAYTNPSSLATWRHAYVPIDPATETLANAGSVFLSTMFSSNYAYAYARDNTNTAARDKADALIDERIWDKSATDEAAPGGGGENLSWKVIGEWVFMMPHSAAWRAGVPWNGWEVAP